MLDTRGNVTRKSILRTISKHSSARGQHTYSVGSSQVHIIGTSRAVEGVEGMHGLDLSSICVHAACSLARLDVAPDHGCHIALVIHETSVKVGSIVGVGADNMGRATREGILQEVEHGEELARRHDHVVTEPARNDGCPRVSYELLIFNIQTYNSA